MRPPRWYRAIPQPFHWGAGGAIVVAVAGAAYGVFESVRDYPLSSWFGVTLFLTMLGTLAGFLLGFIAGTFAFVAGLVPTLVKCRAQRGHTSGNVACPPD